MAPYVLLLREPSSPPETDRYEAALSRASFRPLSLPVLETVLENVESLFRIFRGGDDDQCTVDGVIVTSARAVDACAHAGADIDWGKVRFYAVGPATTAQLARLPNPPRDVRGAESGTAERLAHYIVQDVKRGDKLLYLTGDKNRDTLPRVVREGLGGDDEVLKELRVYATRGVDNFEQTLARALEGATDDGYEPWWIVFFAPSSAAHVTPAIRVHFSLAMGELSDTSEKKSRLRRARVAAIGPTTGDYLRDTVGVRVDVVPDTPNADSLTLALVRAPKLPNVSAVQ